MAFLTGETQFITQNHQADMYQWLNLTESNPKCSPSVWIRSIPAKFPSHSSVTEEVSMVICSSSWWQKSQVQVVHQNPSIERSATNLGWDFWKIFTAMRYRSEPNSIQFSESLSDHIRSSSSGSSVTVRSSASCVRPVFWRFWILSITSSTLFAWEKWWSSQPFILSQKCK